MNIIKTTAFLSLFQLYSQALYPFQVAQEVGGVTVSTQHFVFATGAPTAESFCFLNFHTQNVCIKLGKPLALFMLANTVK